MAPSTSAPSQHSMGATSHGSGSNRGPKKANSTSGRSQKHNNQNMALPSPGFMNMGLPNEQQIQMQAALQQKQMLANKAIQAMKIYENQAPSNYPPPDFTKLMYPIERMGARVDLSAVPSVCWEAIGTNICFLCAVPSHFYYECPLYPGQMPGTTQCGCSGFHLSECRMNLRPLMDHPSRHGWFVPQPPPKREGQNGGQVQNPNQYPNPNPRYRLGQGGQGGQGGPAYGQAYSNGIRNNNSYGNGGGNPRYQGGNNRFNNGGGNGQRYPGPRGNGNGNNERRFDNRRNDGNGGGRNNNGGYNNNGGNGDGNNQNHFGFPNQNGAQGGGVPMGVPGPAMDNTNQANLAPHRAGVSLGNSGSQAVPLTAIMNPAQVQTNN